MSDEKTSEEWEIYPCHVDGSPASILLNLAFHNARPTGADTLYYVGLQILDHGEHGLGTNTEAESLMQVEAALVSAAAKMELTHVGRVRHDGDWQLAFYGATGLEPQLEEALIASLQGHERGYRIGSQADPDWRYYREFLTPSTTQLRWMLNRRVVQSLLEHGDELSQPRKVDHYLWFPTASERAAFENAAKELGFTVEDERQLDDEVERPFGAHIARVDPVELESIHEIVIELIALASHQGGEYDGWGAPVVRSE